MQVRYDELADRLLWQVRTADARLYEVWLTRRLLKLLWPPFQQLVTQAGVAQLLPRLGASATAQGPSLLPEAQAMLAEQARQRPLPSAEFGTRFAADGAERPLGEQPMLPVSVDLGPTTGDAGAPAGLLLRLRDGQQRALELRLTSDLATALDRLLAQALQAADWALPGAAAPGARPTAPPGPGQRLN